MNGLHVSAHAIERYQERVRHCSEDEARAALSSPTIIKAAHFGAPHVLLSGGQRVVIFNFSVVTVLPATQSIEGLRLSRFAEHWEAWRERGIA